MLDDLKLLASKYGNMQRNAIRHASDESLRQHIAWTLCRCLPPAAVTESFVSDCYEALQDQDSSCDPMHTGAIHAFAGKYLLHTSDEEPLMKRLHHSACRLLPPGSAATRDSLRLITLDALFDPQLLPQGMHIAFVRHRLGLKDGVPRSCEEIAAFMHKPLTYIHELESAILTVLSSNYTGGHHA